MANSVSKQMENILSAYSKEVSEVADKETKASSKDCASELRNVSAKKTGEYARGWTSKKNGDGYVTYNKSMPGLTHLLERGHAIVNKKGNFGRVPGDGKIADAEAKYIAECIANIERDLL